MIKLRPKDWQRIIAIAQQTLPENAQIIAYGSRVDGSAHQASDLDLMIKTPDDQKLLITQLIEFKEALRQSNIPILIDVFDWHKTPQTFKDTLNNTKCETLY